MGNIDIHALKNQILEIVRKEGPILPAQISQKVISNVLFTSAILSDLSAQGQVKLSKAKIGSSPVYYAKGQEPKLQMLYKHLGEKPRKIYDILKEKKVIRDKELEPWQRVAIREIKDFAMMLNVSHQSEQEIFWKWYLTSDEEAKKKVVETLKQEMPQEEPEQEEPKQEELKPEPKEELKKELVREPNPEKEEQAKEKKENIKKPVTERFYGMVNTYFSDNRIVILEESAIRKNTEYEFVIGIPSALGNLRYFVTAKNKKKISDAELNMAYTNGERKKLPTIFMSTGDMTKKAEKYLDTHLKGLVFKKIR